MRKSIEEKVERFDDTSTHTPKDGQCQLLSRYCNWESNVPPKRSSHAKFQVICSIGGWVTSPCPKNRTLLFFIISGRCFWDINWFWTFLFIALQLFSSYIPSSSWINKEIYKDSHLIEELIINGEHFECSNFVCLKKGYNKMSMPSR